MVAVDSEQQRILYHVAVIGGVSQRFVELLQLKNGELELSEVKGHRPALVFHPFSDDPWAGDGSEGARLEDVVPMLDAIVLTDDYAAGMHYSSVVVERLSQVLAPLKLRMPSGVFGGPALAEEWQSLSGVAPLHVADPRGDDALSVVKALVKVLLRSGLRSTAPPPPHVE